MGSHESRTRGTWHGNGGGHGESFPSLLSPPFAISYPESSGSLVSGLVARRDLWGNGLFSIFLIGYSGNNEIGEAEVGSMLTLPSIMSWTSQETSAIFQRGQQVTLLVL